MEETELKAFLEEKVDQYNSNSFIETDPIQVPHQFNAAGDIEIAAFLTATLSWGQKQTIIAKAGELVSLMPGGPHEFIHECTGRQLNRFLSFVHRTFNGMDCIYFMKALQRIYRYHGGLRAVFEQGYSRHGDLFGSMVDFRRTFFGLAEPGRTAKHVADPSRGATAKRLNMFLRWMIRRDHRGVDFGLWEGIPMHALYMPLDVHTGGVARKLGLLKRKQNDWRAVLELTEKLRRFDPHDPVRYDFALFGLGSFEKF
jgi:uncharacterized protein (TIGR02757 family)